MLRITFSVRLPVEFAEFANLPELAASRVAHGFVEQLAAIDLRVVHVVVDVMRPAFVKRAAAARISGIFFASGRTQAVGHVGLVPALCDPRRERRLFHRADGLYDHPTIAERLHDAAVRKRRAARSSICVIDERVVGKALENKVAGQRLVSGRNDVASFFQTTTGNDEKQEDGEKPRNHAREAARRITRSQGRARLLAKVPRFLLRSANDG